MGAAMASHFGPINMCLSFPNSTIGMKWACWKYLDESDSRSFSEGARVRLTYLTHVWYFNSLPISASLCYSNKAKVSSASLSKRSEAAIEESIKRRLRGYITKENLPKTSTKIATIRPSPGGDRSPIHASTLKNIPPIGRRTHSSAVSRPTFKGCSCRSIRSASSSASLLNLSSVTRSIAAQKTLNSSEESTHP